MKTEKVAVTYGSVCSGIEAASVAWEPLGWRAAWLSEIDVFPSAVLAHRFPAVMNLGDMTKIPELVASGDVSAPDVLVGGTPCQAFSVAGMRAGLRDPRGQLTIKFVEIADAIDDVRRCRDELPAIIVWENVPGVLSDKGNAFGCFLGALAGEDCELQPAGGKWSNAGCVFGPARAIAWRVLDSQYFGVAQRRRRVFVVASARTGFDPSAILFEFDGMRRDTPPSRGAGEETAGTLASRTGAGGFPGTDEACSGYVQPIIRGLKTTKTTSSHTHKFDGKGLQHIVGSLCADTHPGAYSGQDAYTGRLVPFPVNLMAFHILQDPISSTDGRTHAMGCGSSSGQASIGVAYPMLEVGKRTGASTTDTRAGMGIGSDTDPMFTLQAGAQHGVAVAVSLRGREGGATAELGDEVQNCLRASSGGGDKAHVLAPVCVTGEVTHTLKADGFDGSEDGTGRGQPIVAHSEMAVRRLTPRECERLQGFPDDWTLVPVRGKPAADGPRYKAIGNSMAVPVMRWIGRRIDHSVSAGISSPQDLAGAGVSS